ncbi:MAG: hypothetical protein U1E53_07495 [Dongiaceae bacterium]
MGKPFNAGIAAANGVEAAELARRGFVSCDDGVGGPQGFVETHSDGPDLAGPWADPPPARFVFEANQYKLHACCHGTHAMIEALAEARRGRAIDPAAVTGVTVATHPRWLRVCDVKAPRTGLEAKFSYVLLAAMVLHGIDTAADRTYTDALCRDPALLALAARVAVTGDESLADTASRVEIALAGGERIAAAHDLAAAIPEAVLESGLRGKARGLLGEAAAERLWSAVTGLDRLSARDLGALLAG